MTGLITGGETTVATVLKAFRGSVGFNLTLRWLIPSERSSGYITTCIHLSALHLSVCLSAGGDRQLSDLQKSTKLLLPQVSSYSVKLCIKMFLQLSKSLSELILVSMTTGSELSGPSPAVRSTQSVTLTTAAAVTSLTLTEHKLPSYKESLKVWIPVKLLFASCFSLR